MLGVAEAALNNPNATEQVPPRLEAVSDGEILGVTDPALDNPDV
jgi:hypothetical protein